PEILFIRDMPDDVYFHGEEEPWRIVIENLVENALRYAESYIIIRLREGELSVSNDGKKIEVERLKSLFKPYEKGDDGKFGLGLSIVHKVATTYGYSVRAENLSDGVCFRIFSKNQTKKSNKKNKGKS
ncbi:MAG: sensor histidine kinase, partial [Solobacterium sp.]|nr:sensor histidine kinase [Solobacterium sp.]